MRAIATRDESKIALFKFQGWLICVTGLLILVTEFPLYFGPITIWPIMVYSVLRNC